jgi:CBS domain-containing protein
MHKVSSVPELVLFGFWVGQLNIVLGIFNLLPAFPTDGGRVLRSLLVSRQGRLRGTRNAVKVSRMMAWFFGILGLLQFNIILMLIAFFIYTAAQSELFVVTAITVLKGMKVREVMRPVTAIPGDATLHDAASIMLQRNTTLIPVATTGEQFYGMVSIGLLKRLPKESWRETRLRDVVTDVTDPCRPHDDLDESVITNLVGHPHGLPVVEDSQVIGLVRLSDVNETIQLRELTSELRAENAFESYRPT